MADANKPAKAQQGHSVVTDHRQETVSFHGPLPPPALLEQYNRVIPNGAERVIRLAEDEAVHRRKQEIKIVDAGISDDRSHVIERRLGQIFGLTIGLFTVACGTYAAVQGHPWAGSFIGGSGVTGLVIAFIHGSKRQ